MANHPNLVGVRNPSGPIQNLDPIDRLARDADDDLQQGFPGLTEQFSGISDIRARVGEEDAVTAAERRAAQGSRVDEGTFERQTRGQDLSDRQKLAAKKRLGLSRSISRANAAGQVRRGFEDRALGVNRLSGSLSDALFGQRIGAGADAANIFGQRTAANVRRSAERKSSTLSTVGKVAGLALSFMFSSENYKDDHGKEGKLLDRLKNVRINRWNYKGDKQEHVGPFSEEFNKEFGIKTERPDTISVIDYLGVTLGAVKELNEKMERSNGN